MVTFNKPEATEFTMIQGIKFECCNCLNYQITESKDINEAVKDAERCGWASYDTEDEHGALVCPRCIGELAAIHGA